MSKPLKVLLWIVGGVVALIAVLLVAATFLLHPNAYKGQIEVAARQQTGRTLTIAGDITLKVFPWLALEIGSTELGNAQGFGPEPMLQFEDVRAGINLLPLIFERKIELGTIAVHGLNVRLAKDKDGKDNWSDLSGPEKKEEPPKPEEKKPEGPGLDLAAIKIGGIDIDDANVSYSDAQKNVSYKLQKLKLQSGAIGTDKPVDLLLQAVLNATQPQVNADVKLTTKLTTDFAARHFQAKALKLNLAVNGAAIPGGKQKLDMEGDVDYDGAKGTFALDGGEIDAGDLKLKAALAGADVTGDNARFNGHLESTTFNPRTLAQGFGVALPATTDPKALSSASFRTDLAATKKSARLDKLQIKLDDTTLSGSAEVRDFTSKAVAFGLAVDSIDADRYLPPPPAGAPAKSDPAKPHTAADTAALNATPIPVDALDALNADGNFSIGALKAKNLHFKDVKMTVKAAHGAPKTETLNAQFYGGTIAQSATIKPGAQPAIALNADMNGIQAGPAGKDFMGKDLLDGTGMLKLAITGNGKTVGDVRRTLNGNVAFSFLNGSINGFNVGEMIRKGRALIKGQSYTPPATPPKTDFAELSGSGKIVNGILSSNDVALKSPLLRFSGDGKVDLVKETIDYLAKPVIVDTGKGQGGKELDDLHGIPIPMRVKGDLYAPDVSFDWSQVISGAAKAKAQEKVQKELNKGLDKALGNFLGGKKKKK